MNRKQFVPNMNLFADTRTKRNTAFVVLLVWLFALVSGVANACALTTPELQSKAVKALAPTTSRAPAEWVGSLGTRAGHVDESDSAKESCLKVCDDGTHTVPNAYSAVDHTDPGLAPLVATLWSGSAQVVPVPHRLDDWAISIVGPSVRVRYSRLAL